MDILWTKSGFHICFHVQTLSYWTKSGQILDFHVQYMSKSFMIGQGFDRHWTGLDSGWTDLVNFPAFGQTLDRGWTWFGFCVQALSNQPSLRSTQACLACSLLSEFRPQLNPKISGGHSISYCGSASVVGGGRFRWSVAFSTHLPSCFRANCAFKCLLFVQVPFGQRGEVGNEN